MMDQHIIRTIHSHLTHSARSAEDFVYYSDVIRWAGIGHLGEGALEGALGNTFFEVNQYDWSQDPNRPMLSAIAVSSQTYNPSAGFYRLAREKGRLTSKQELDEITFWINELAALRAYWQARAETTFKGIAVTYEAVYGALQAFGESYPDPDERWLDDDRYAFALEFAGRLYPPKYILSAATGLSRSQFHGGDQANEVFQRLGLVIVDKPGVASQIQSPGHATYLLTWNPGKSAWDTFQEDWESVYVGNRPRLEWSCGNTRRVQIGDRVFLMRLGWREKVTGILASGWVTGEPLEGPHWAEDEQTALYVEFEPDVLLNPETDELLDPKIVSQDFNWSPQRSGITIPNQVAVHLEQAWQRQVQRTYPGDASEKASRQEPITYTEGARKPVYSYRYERDPRAREACLQQYGTRCVVCEFDFGEAFGAIGEGFIHVHHLTPISERDSEYVIDPIEDLRPVCPNCHAMLHRRIPPYSIEELQDIRQHISKR